jgi:FKBP-type peptidyl-prolyl cis-trans isomerase FkpA
MTKPLFLSTLLALVLSAACGGSTPPGDQTKPAEMPAAPPNTVGPADTPPAASPGASAEPAAKPTTPAPAEKPAPPARPAFTRTDLQAGSGREAQKGKGLTVQYTGWLYDPSKPDLKGRMFDTSRDRGPFNFVLGAGQVIPGWDQGFEGMRIGGRRRLIIPPDLAYGVDGAGNGIIPPNATLIFEMELLDVQQ